MEVRELLDRTTQIYRSGPKVTESEVTPGIKRVDVWLNTPPETERPADDDPDWQVVDVHFFRCAVNKAEAELLREEFYDLMDNWPADPTYQSENRLDNGPSYIELGAQIGTFMGQQDAMRLMALGQVLGCWYVITPRRLFKATGMSDEELDDMQVKLDQLAGKGYIMISGYKKPESV